jgi:hypothetical protein
LLVILYAGLRPINRIVVRVKVALAVYDGLLESVTRKVRLRFDTVANDVPLITPVDASNVNPPGRTPEMSGQIYGVCPPATVNVCEYGTPTFTDLTTGEG